ncbi:glycosyltransferase [Methanosarcina sp. 2.H.T.1A.6]|uniref:UDP-N-acetylglucosamine--N-acetylmuramyl- (pentapeptide) pyrophosphoryl-undecaprenol N-acetylglucosamine transferase n=1 Tax=unclassified Methanosarcina TaxID=2644672 RepID=UPI000621CB93|nr:MULTISPECIES: glycosyltransferase [unclassified Methanosarcina]KKG16154.1 glycosyltransferase [Methanosarcina sp. 2.H.T.1A.3]KKG23126.1 glycosyltransferase [Methanosarcina sp. 2.H.T.1A.6]KKG26349.1 glycosyltransferase [Methanosarcina sp. 2.H.T.1A.8]KKG28086.1 glycosyltransferase [Methanosarcina sp. 2.H.T.1A.15]
MKIMIFICGEGLGHTSRCLALGKEMMSAGHEVHFGAYGYSKELIEKVGYKAHDIPSEIKLVGKEGALDFTGSVEATLKNAQLLGGPKILKLTRDIGPDAVVSDSYYLGILAAKALKLPVYLILNQSNMEEFFKSRGVPIRLLGELTKKVYNQIFEMVDRIIIPDYPLPYTVCRKNLSFTHKIREKLFYSGPLVQKKYDEVEEISLKKPHIISLIGGFGYREPIFRKVLETAKLDSGIHYTLISGPSLDPSKFTDLPENVQVLQFIKDTFPYFKSSDAVIAPGGHSTMMEALSFGIPIISFPDEGHNEQESNAEVVEEEGYGRKLSYSTPPAVILECIREVLEDRAYRNKTERLRKLANELDGPKSIRELLEKEAGQDAS